MRQTDGLCCIQRERMFAGNWVYKHIDTSMAIRKRGARLSVPWPLDDRLLFKATQEDNSLYRMVNLVNTILRYALLLIRQVVPIEDPKLHQMQAIDHHPYASQEGQGPSCQLWQSLAC